MAIPQTPVFVAAFESTVAAIANWIKNHSLSNQDAVSTGQSLDWLTALVHSTTEETGDWIGDWQLRSRGEAAVELWIQFDGVELEVPLEAPCLSPVQYSLICDFVAAQSARDRAAFNHEARHVNAAQQPIWLGWSSQQGSSQLTITLSLPFQQTSPPLAGWNPKTVAIIDQIRRHLNGLVIVGHRAYSADQGQGASHRIFQQIFQAISFERPAFIGSSLEGMPHHPHGVYLQVAKETPAAWAEACQVAVSQHIPLIFLRGRDARMVLQQAVTTALEDCWVVMDVPLIGVETILNWLMSLPEISPIEIAAVLLGITSAYPGVLPICPHCKAPMDLEAARLDPAWPATEPSDRLLDRLRAEGIEQLPEGNWMQGVGCDRCNHSGYQKRMADRLTLSEAIYVDRQFSRLLAKRPDAEQIRTALRDRGFRSYWDDALEQAQKGEITLQSAVYRSFGRRVEF